MIIAPDFVFLMVPRCGSNTLRAWLTKNFEAQSIEPHHGWIVPEEYRHLPVHLVIRNPYDRMLSMWYHIKRHSGEERWRTMGAEEFAERCGELEFGMPQAEYLETPAELLRVHIYELWSDLCIDSVRAPTERLNAEQRPPWQKDPALTAAFISAVNRHEARTFKLTGYPML